MKTSLGISELQRLLDGLSRAGQPLTGGLGALSSSLTNPRQAALLADLSARIERGESPAAAIAQAASALPAAAASLLNAAAAAQQPADVYRTLARIARRRNEVQQRTQTLLLYPLLVAFLSILVIGVQLVTIFRPGRLLYAWPELPIIRPFIRLLDLLLSQPHAGFAGLLAVFGLILWASSAGCCSEWRFRILQRLPLISHLVRLDVLASFFDLLQVLLASGISLPDAVEAAAQGVGDPRTVRAAYNTGRQLRAGEPPRQALAELTPRFMRGLLATALQRNALPAVCAEISAFYSQERETAAPVLLHAFQVLLVLLAGFFVGIAALNLFTPLFNSIGSPFIWGQ